MKKMREKILEIIEQEHKAHQVLQDLQVKLDHKDLQVQQVHKEFKAFKVHQALMEHKVHQVLAQ
jgi:hypothetical protein